MEKFNYEPNGYNRKEVNKFVSDVIDQTSGIVNKYIEQKETIKNQQKDIVNLKLELDRYKTLESNLKDQILRSERNAEQIKIHAKEEANMIIMDAKSSASRIVNEALIKAEEVEMKTRIAQRNLKIFKQKLKIVVDQQKAIVDEIDDIEII
ncbi:MAG: DivIVA domain-containing protein [Bacilli bacterium]|nr:DivIVA domain-containing protein [Bacilli bacterium]